MQLFLIRRKFDFFVIGIKCPYLKAQKEVVKLALLHLEH